MQEQKQQTAIFVGVWPLADAHDPALDDAGIPKGAAIFGLFDQSYIKFAIPDTIPGLTQVATLDALKQGCWCGIHASSGFSYITAMAENPTALTIEMKEIPSMVTDKKTFMLKIPATRFIGKKFGDADRVDGNFGAKWDEFFQKGWFNIIMSSPGFVKRYIDDVGWYENNASYAGLMRWKEGEPFQYWIGLFCSPETAIPEGFSYISFPESAIGDCVLYAPPEAIYGQDDYVMKCLDRNGIIAKANANGEWWWFERETESSHQTDEIGCRILEHCYFLN